MLLQLIEQLRQQRIVLASQSPRRKELIERLGLAVDIRPSTFAEDLDKASFASPAEYAVATATAKAVDVFEALRRDGGGDRPCAMVIASDTIVVAPGGAIFEKAATAAAAKEMLLRLSGDSSTVHTGVALLFPAAGAGAAAPYEVRTFSETTVVRFAAVSAAEADCYVADEAAWRGKAGAYGIQDRASVFIEGIDGDYYNVMGFPVHRFSATVAQCVQDGLIPGVAAPSA
jgi:septum formation protein